MAAPGVLVEKDGRAVNLLELVRGDVSDLVVPHKRVSEALARSRELVADAVVLHARGRELLAEARRKIHDHRYLLVWPLRSWELVSERSSDSRLDDAVIRDFARYGALDGDHEVEGLGPGTLGIRRDAGELKWGLGRHLG